jgi:hypothetical protein
MHHTGASVGKAGLDSGGVCVIVGAVGAVVVCVGTGAEKAKGQCCMLSKGAA